MPYLTSTDGFEIRLDQEDMDRASGYRWTTYHPRGTSGDIRYATNCEAGTMSRFLLGLTKGDRLIVHHANERPLDNRRKNLEVMTSGEHAVLHTMRRQRLREAIQDIGRVG